MINPIIYAHLTRIMLKIVISMQKRCLENDKLQILLKNLESHKRHKFLSFTRHKFLQLSMAFKDDQRWPHTHFDSQVN